MLIQAHVPYAEWGQTIRNTGGWSRERIMQVDEVAHVSKILKFPKGFQQSVFKCQIRERVSDGMWSDHAVVVQSLSPVQLFVTPWTAAHQASLSFSISRSLLKLMSIELVTPSKHLILCHPLLLLLSAFSSIKVFSSELVLHIRWPKYWSFSFNISSFHEYSGLISFRMDWFDLLAVHETLKSHLQHYNSKASILHHSAFFRANSHNCTLLMEKP